MPAVIPVLHSTDQWSSEPKQEPAARVTHAGSREASQVEEQVGQGLHSPGE